MIKFVKVSINRTEKKYKNLQFLEKIYHLYKKYYCYLSDDYADFDNILDEIINLIERTSPFFWVILDNDNFAGFVFLENIIGSKDKMHSAEITTAFKKEYWGDFTKKSAIKFIRYCFKKLNFKKLKALVFKENVKTTKILKTAGFKFEAELKSETLKNRKLQDIKVYSITQKR